MNPKYYDDKCFQYALTAALNYQNIKRHPQRISNLALNILFMQFWSIALNILFMPYNTEKIRLAYKSKHNLKCIILMTTVGKKWHYFAVKFASIAQRNTIKS